MSTNSNTRIRYNAAINVARICYNAAYGAIGTPQVDAAYAAANDAYKAVIAAAVVLFKGDTLALENAVKVEDDAYDGFTYDVDDA